LTPLEIDEHLAAAGMGMSNSTRHHDVVALERLQKFAIEHKMIDKPVFGKQEKPRVGRRDRVPPSAETEALLAKASPTFRLMYSALRQCGARPGELCRTKIADVDRANRIIDDHSVCGRIHGCFEHPNDIVGRRLSCGCGSAPR